MKCAYGLPTDEFGIHRSPCLLNPEHAAKVAPGLYRALEMVRHKVRWTKVQAETIDTALRKARGES
jgi:hypothetical protein